MKNLFCVWITICCVLFCIGCDETQQMVKPAVQFNPEPPDTVFVVSDKELGILKSDNARQVSGSFGTNNADRIFPNANSAFESELLTAFFTEAENWIAANCKHVRQFNIPSERFYFTTRQARRDFINDLSELGGVFVEGFLDMPDEEFEQIEESLKRERNLTHIHVDLSKGVEVIEGFSEVWWQVEHQVARNVNTNELYFSVEIRVNRFHENCVPE